MARIGINPARGKTSSYRPARVTVALLTYIPGLDGYFQDRLRILQLVLASLRAHTTPAHDLLIFDNGSCQAVVDYLTQMKSGGQIDYLLLSEKNIGKIGAFQIIFHAAPGEVIAYSDDDILFYPNWLEAQLAILDNFPKAGMVSGTPVRNAAGHACQSLEEEASQGTANLTVTWQRRIPDAWERDWAISTGRNPDKHLHTTADHKDMVLQMEIPSRTAPLEAIGSANHFQFIARKRVLIQALPDKWSGKLMGAMIELDEAIDALGYLRLSTVERYTRHLGNVLSPEVSAEAQSMGLFTSPDQDAGFDMNERGTKPTKHPLLRIPGSRRFLYALYHRLFNILYRW